MNTFQGILQDSVGMSVALFIEGGMFIDGKVVAVNGDSVTVERNIQAEQQAFSAGADIRRTATIHATVLIDKLVRVDRIATKRAPTA